MVMLNSSLKESLVELNRKEAEQYLGGVIFVTVVMVVGIIGNMHVLFVYTFRIQRSNHRIFILVLGVLDFITCTVGMPFIIFDLRNPLTFTVSSVCKLLRFTNYFTCTSSSLILVLIAIDRRVNFILNAAMFYMWEKNCCCCFYKYFIVSFFYNVMV